MYAILYEYPLGTVILLTVRSRDKNVVSRKNLDAFAPVYIPDGHVTTGGGSVAK